MGAAVLSPRTHASFNIGARFRSSPIVDGLEFPAERPVGEASRRGEDGGAGPSRRRGAGGAFAFSKSQKRMSSELGGGEEESLASPSGSGGLRSAKRTLTALAGTDEAAEDGRGGEACREL